MGHFEFYNEKLKIKQGASIRLFNRWARYYDEGIINRWLNSVQDLVVNELKFHIGKRYRVLDIGSGTGELLIKVFYACKNIGINGVRLYGIDISNEMIKVANHKFYNHKIKCKIKLAEASKLPFKNNFFDFVISTEAFHHFPEQFKALIEMKRVLKVNGKLILVDVNFFFLSGVFCMLEPGCVKVNSFDSFRELFADAGLKLEKQERLKAFAILNVCRK